MERGEPKDTRTNLIINYLPQTLTDAEFKNLFMAIGPVQSCKIVRHKGTGYSYGFGFVEYSQHDDAIRAIDTLNGFQLQNKRIKVAYARPSGEAIKNANLYIKGIPKSMDEEELQCIFSESGGIIQCRILRGGSNSQNKGVAFILFDRKEQADDAIKKFNGKTLPGGIEPLSIKYTEDSAKKIRPPPSFSPSVLAYGSPLRGPFGSGGPMRQTTLQSRYRFNPLMTPTSSLMINSNSGGGSGTILFVYNIGPFTDEKTLYQLFTPYGTVQKVNVIRDSATGEGKGYGFVTMSSYDEALWAIEALNGYQFSGKPLQVSFKTAK